MKIGPAVRPGCRIEKKGKDGTGQDSTVEKVTSGNISPIWGEAPTVPIKTKICMAGNLADVITCAKFQDEIFKGYDFTGGRISHFPIDFRMGLTTVQRDCAACDTPQCQIRVKPRYARCTFRIAYSWPCACTTLVI